MFENKLFREIFGPKKKSLSYFMILPYIKRNAAIYPDHPVLFGWWNTRLGGLCTWLECRGQEMNTKQNLMGMSIPVVNLLWGEDSIYLLLSCVLFIYGLFNQTINMSTRCRMAKEQQTGIDEEGSTYDLVWDTPTCARGTEETLENLAQEQECATDSTATFQQKVPVLTSYQTLSSEIKFLHVSYVSAELQRRHAHIYTSV